MSLGEGFGVRFRWVVRGGIRLENEGNGGGGGVGESETGTICPFGVFFALFYRIFRFKIGHIPFKT